MYVYCFLKKILFEKKVGENSTRERVGRCVSVAETHPHSKKTVFREVRAPAALSEAEPGASSLPSLLTTFSNH